MIGTVASPQSVWTRPGEGEWAGHVIYNGGEAEWVDTRKLDAAPGPRGPYARGVRVGGGAKLRSDHLFIPDEADADGNTGTNAAMVFATDRDHEAQK